MRPEGYQPDMETQELARAISNWVNTHPYAEFNDLVALIAMDHRTLQQKFTGFVLRWILHCAELKMDQFDLRNAESVHICQQIKEAVPSIQYRLPLI